MIFGAVQIHLNNTQSLNKNRIAARDTGLKNSPESVTNIYI